MAHFFSSFIQYAKKFFAPFPHLSASFLTLFIPILPWYLFLKGLLKSIAGFRALSGSFQLGSLPRIFSDFFPTHPLILFWDGVLHIIVGVLYFAAFTAVSSAKTREKGWRTWVQAAFLLSATQLYEALLFQHSFFWLFLKMLFYWYLIFEFGRILISPAARSSATPAHRKRKRSRK